jgi:hypothetical protein
MTNPPIGTVDILRIDTVELTPASGKIGRRLYNDMIVVGHLTISMANAS